MERKIINSRQSKTAWTRLNSAFKRTINWNKYQRKLLTERETQYLDFLTGPRFQGVNRLFVLPFEDEAQGQVTKDNIFWLEK